MMHVELKVGESVIIGNVTVSLDDKSGKTARLSIDADRSIPIKRLCIMDNYQESKQKVVKN